MEHENNTISVVVSSCRNLFPVIIPIYLLSRFAYSHVMSNTFLIISKASTMDSAPGDNEDKKKAVLEQRRAILLTAVSETPSENPTVPKILEDGYLNSVKVWLDEVLNKTVGEWTLLAAGAVLST